MARLDEKQRQLVVEMVAAKRRYGRAVLSGDYLGQVIEMAYERGYYGSTAVVWPLRSGRMRELAWRVYRRWPSG